MSNELVLDVGNLAAFDGRLGLEGTLQTRAEDGLQKLVRAIFSLETEDTDDGKVVALPPPTTKLPREKPIPRPKEPTKWEKYMQKKGITKRKRDRLVWDEELNDFLPRYGKRSAKRLKNEEGIVEEEEVVERRKPPVAKKTKKSHRRKAYAEKINNALSVAQNSTASAGRFDKKLKDEPKRKQKGRKRKFDPVATSSLSKEKERAMKVANRVLGGLG